MVRTNFPGAAVSVCGLLLISLTHPVWAGPGYLSTLGKFRNTYYVLAQEKDFSDLPQNAEVLDIHGNILAQVSERFKKKLDLEGSGILRNGTIVNFSARVNGEIRYRFTQNHFGDGAGQCALVPFRTIAIDPRKVALGSTVRIEETIGMQLPDGTIHDGTWYANDVGSAIQNDRVDLFVGTEDLSHYLDAAGITHLRPLTFHLVAPPAEDSCAYKTAP